MDDSSKAADTEPEAAPGAPEAGASTARPRRAPMNADGMERPAFLLDFPEDPALEPLIEAFEAGNYARVREGAELLARTTESATVRDAALELRRRLEPDPLAKYLLAISVVLLIVLTVWAYYVEPH
jgi:hypothetical protein